MLGLDAMSSSRPTACASILAATIALASVSARAQRVQLADPLTLDRALQIAEQRRREVDAAQSSALAAAQRPAIVSVPDDPMVMATVGHLPIEMLVADGEHDAANEPAIPFDWNVMAQLSFPLGDVLGSRARAARAEARRREHDVDRTVLDVQAEAAMAFLELYLARELDSLLEEQIALADQLAAASRARYAAGMGAQTDALRAEVELVRLRAERAALAGTIEGAAGMLVAALGLSAGTSIPPLAEPTDAPLPSAAQAAGRALRRRPELAAMRESVLRAEAGVSEMEGMYWPMMTVQLGGAYTMAEGAGVMGAVGISIPIFRDRLDAGVTEARAMVSMAEADVDAMERMIEGQVASVRGQVLAARARRDALVLEVVPRARQAVDAGLAQYGAGQVPQVTVIEALRALFDVHTSAVRAEVDAAMAAVRLGRALGSLR